jgi:zinc protease
MSHFDCRRLLWTLAALTPLAACSLGVSPSRGADEPKDKSKDADAAVAKAVSSLYDGVRVETLDNGLRVYLKPVPGSPVVTTMVAYKVGSADEDLDATGLSHYLEHLMFKGTEKIKPGEIDHITFQNGGMNNAYTDTDYTIYHFDFPYDRWEAALDVEADRMLNLRIDAKHEFEQEKGAVCNELARDEDEPWDLEQKAILPMLYGKSAPLGHPVIGEEKHVKGATADVIKKHYDKWYHPNNASLVIVGGFDPDKAMEKIKKVFESIPKADLPPRKKTPEDAKPAKRPALLEMDSKFPTPRLLYGWNTVSSTHDDYPALTVLEGLLNGRTSRLYKKLVEGDQIAVSIAASHNSAGRYPGWFSVQAELLDKKDREKAEKIIAAELKKLADEPITDAELKRVKRNVLASAVYGRESVHGLADDLARGVTVNDLDYLKKVLPRVLAVNAADVQRVVKTYLDPQARVLVWSAPKEGATAPLSSEPKASAKARTASAADAVGGDFPLKDVKREVLPNGLILLLYENHRAPVVVAQASLRHVGLFEPDDKLGVGTLTGYMLSEGTTKNDGPKIAEMIEDVGGSLDLSSAGGTVRVLSPDRSLGLGLLFDSLTQPTFPEEAFKRNKDRLLSGIKESDAQPETVAQKNYRAAVYGKHPLGRPGSGTVKTVEALTPKDLVEFHKKVFTPSNVTLAVVGDFDAKEVIEEVKKLTADWKKTELTKPETPEIGKPKEFTQKILTIPDAAQLHFYLGHVGVRRDNPDYYKLLVLDYILGRGPGFTYRLSKLRDREGLAYTVSGSIASSADLEPGTFTCYIGTDNENFERVKKEILEEVNKIRDEKCSKEEVEDAKNYLIGNLSLEFTSNAAIASQLQHMERHKLGEDYLTNFKKAVAAVTPEDVQAVAKKYLDPEHMYLVAAGAVDAKGKPTAKAPPPKPEK